MEIIKAQNTEEARKLIEKIKPEKAAVFGRDIEFNRKILENRKVEMLILNHKMGKDSLKQRDSGLNQVLCKIAKENNITLAIDFNDLNEGDKRDKAKILARIKQNIKLIKKFKNKVVILNKPDDKLNLAAFLRVLGADTKLAKDASEN